MKDCSYWQMKSPTSQRVLWSRNELVIVLPPLQRIEAKHRKRVRLSQIITKQQKRTNPNKSYEMASQSLARPPLLSFKLSSSCNNSTNDDATTPEMVRLSYYYLEHTDLIQSYYSICCFLVCYSMPFHYRQPLWLFDLLQDRLMVVTCTWQSLGPSISETISERYIKQTQET